MCGARFNLLELENDILTRAVGFPHVPGPLTSDIHCPLHLRPRHALSKCVQPRA